MWSSFFLLLCPILAHGHLAARAAPDTFSLYAYGNGLFNGYQVFVADGLAYIGNLMPPNYTVAANVTFTPGGNDNRVWYASPNTTTNPNVSFAGNPALYLDPVQGPNRQVGIANTSALPDNAVDDGFTWYGTRAMFYNSTAGMLQSKFWAELWFQTDDEHGLWRLTWNTQNVRFNSTVPVNLKYTAPVPQTASD